MADFWVFLLGYGIAVAIADAVMWYTTGETLTEAIEWLVRGFRQD